jgi:hypothetical protein
MDDLLRVHVRDTRNELCEKLACDVLAEMLVSENILEELAACVFKP